MNLEQIVKETVAKFVAEKQGKDLTGDGKIDSKDYLKARSMAIDKAKKLAEGDPEYDDMDISNLRSVTIKVRKATDEQLYDLWDFLKDSKWPDSPNHAATKKLVRLELQKRGLKYRYDESQKLAEDNEDHEVSMAQSSLNSILRSAMELKAKIGNNEIDIPAWIQDHITNSENFIDQASQGYHEYENGGHEEMDEEMNESTQSENLTINGKKVKNYSQEGDKSYTVDFEDGTTANFKVSNDNWDIINNNKSQELDELTNNKKLTIPQLGQLKIGDKVKYLGKDKNGFMSGEEYEVSRTESSSTFQPTITIKNNSGKKLRTTNLSKMNNSQELDEFMIRRLQHYAGIK